MPLQGRRREALPGGAAARSLVCRRDELGKAEGRRALGRVAELDLASLASAAT